MTWLLALQLFAFPVTSAYAQQVKQNVIIAVTYAETKPIDVCVTAHALDDVDMRFPTARHCWQPKSVIGDVDNWPNERIDMVNFRVTVKYPTRMDTIDLVWRFDT